MVANSPEQNWGGTHRTGWCNGKESVCQCRRYKRLRFNPWVGKFLGGRNGSLLFSYQERPGLNAWNVLWDREGMGCAPLLWSRGWGPHPKGATPGLIIRWRKQALPGSQGGVVSLD